MWPGARACRWPSAPRWWMLRSLRRWRPGAVEAVDMVIRSEAARSRSTSRSGTPIGYEPGAFCWAGLARSDPAAATAFYARLFDWEAEPLPAGEPGAYTIMRRGLPCALRRARRPGGRHRRPGPRGRGAVAAAPPPPRPPRQ